MRGTTETFGVNLFVPEPGADLAAAPAYRQRLLPLAERFGVELTEPQDDDDWPAKVAALLDDPVPVVSFTFGCPPPEVLRRLAQVGTLTAVGVADVAGAREAIEAGAGALVVQGPDAGGHRATLRCADEPSVGLR